jgi:two-component system, LytTR family, sensor kinase
MLKETIFKLMTLGMNIPRYTSKDIPIMFGSMLPLSLLLNNIFFGNIYWSDPLVFLAATGVTFMLISLAYMFFTTIAIALRNRFPREKDHIIRFGLCIFLYILISAIYLSLILRAYDLFNFQGYQFREWHFSQAFALVAVTDIFLTFLNEGVSRFENYRVTIRETEQLKKEYMQSQLLGLKSQLNPHFLFNNLNTLSSLIHEDAETAEEFLDHMSKVYRYLLRNNDEQLVSLETELNFLKSYYFLLKARHAEGLHLEIEVSEASLTQLIPPLTLQMIFESAISQNSLTRSNPLYLKISSEKNILLIRNTIQPRINQQEIQDIALENIANKMRLLCQKDIEIEVKDDCCERWIRLPLITLNEMEVV